MKTVRKQILASIVLIAIAVSTIGYAQNIIDSITVHTEEAVEVNINKSSIDAPARSAGNITDAATITVSNETLGDTGTVRIRVELIAESDDVYQGFRALIVLVKDGNNVKAWLTKSSPYYEFTENLSDFDGGSNSKVYDVDVIYATGWKPVDAKFEITAGVVGIE